MKRCRHCLAKAELKDDHCSICGIEQDKRKGALTPDEKNARYHARIIRGVAMLHLVGVGAGLIAFLCYPFPIAATLILAVINLTLAIGLSRYAYWAYKMATVYYFLIGMVYIVSVSLPGILLILILLYCVGNSTAKAIFERRNNDVLRG